VVTDNGSNFVKAFKMFPPRDADNDPEADSDEDDGSKMKMFLFEDIHHTERHYVKPCQTFKSIFKSIQPFEI